LGSGFSSPGGVAVDGSRNVFVADNLNGDVKEIVAADGYATIRTLGSGFECPYGIAVDGTGNVFVADDCPGEPGVFEILAEGGYTTVKTLGSGFNQPTGAALDASGNVYVADSGNNAVKEILAASGYATVKTLGSNLPWPFGIAVDGSGNVYVAERDNGSIARLDYADPPAVAFPTPTIVGSMDTTDGAQTVSIWNIGNQPLIFAEPSTGSNPSYPANFPINSNDASLCASGTSLASGTSCDVSMDFTPTGAGLNTASVILTDNALNHAGAKQSIVLNGKGGLTIGTTLRLSNTNWTFAPHVVGSLSGEGVVYVTNTGHATANFASPPLQSSFAGLQFNTTCGPALKPGANCEIQFQYEASALGPSQGTLMLVSDASTSPNVIQIQGVGTGVHVSSPSWSFSPRPVDTTSPAGTIYLTNQSSAPMDLLSTVGITGGDASDFALANGCSAAVPPYTTCTLTFTWTPKAAGTRKAQIAITSAAVQHGLVVIPITAETD
jgi:hypothetical protein